MDALAHPSLSSVQAKLFINRDFVKSLDGGTIDVVSPHDNTLIARIAEASPRSVDLAVDAAARASQAWSSMAAADRGRLLLKLANRIEEYVKELAALETLDSGHPIRDTPALDVPRTDACFRYFGGMADAHGMAQSIRAGMVWINRYKRIDPGSPFGGVGRSGYGREIGFEAMHDYTETRSV